MRLRTSPAAEFQSMQTRAKMGATLWSQTVGTIFVLWIILTVWLVWHRTGTYEPELHHLYFWRWILCGILTDTPLLNHFTTSLPMYAGGSWYRLPDFAAWLDKLYGASFYGWYWQTTMGLGTYGFGSYLLPVTAVTLLFVWWWRRNPDEGHHIRGLSLMNEREFDHAVWRDQ